MNFITGKLLEEAIYDVLYDAQRYLLIVSPYIQLNDYLREQVMKKHLHNAKVHIILVFGKNQTNPQKSLSRADIDYFLDFPNISIVYVPELHGKYYGNEKKSVITSMNLLDYSLLNNIEFGVYGQKGFLKNDFFHTSQSTIFSTIAEKGYTIFVRRPNYEKKLFGLSKDFVGAVTQLNLIDRIFSNLPIEKRTFSDFSQENYVSGGQSSTRINREEAQRQAQERESAPQATSGYCVRCKASIPHNPYEPLCDKCFGVWVQYQNDDYPEQYCHSCGKQAPHISYAKPLCYPCYKNKIQ